MRITAKKIFSIVCMLLLVFTTMAPSLALANEPTVHTIKVETGDDSREIQQAYGVITQEKSDSWQRNVIRVEFNNQTLSMEFLKENLDISKNYRFAWVVQYSEGEQGYYYIDEKDLTGAELLLMDSFTLPAADQLTETSIANDIPNFNIYHFWLNIGKNSIFDLASLHISSHNLDSHKLVKRNDASSSSNITINGSDYTDETINNYLNYSISDALDFTTTVNNLSDYAEDLVDINIDSAAESVGFFNFDTEITTTVGKEVHISKGEYQLNYGNEERWWGNISIQNSETLVLPTTLSELGVEVHHSYNAQNGLSLAYSVTAKSGNFKMNQSQGNTASRLLLGEEVVSEWDSEYGYNNHQIDMGKHPSGTYTLEVTSEIGGETITGKTEFKYTSSWQELKGTVITAENAEGEMLLNAEATLYELNSDYGYQAYEEVTMEKALSSESNGEIFIPDAYILSGQEYLLIVKSEADKVVYANKFIGQSTNTIHLENTALKDINLNTNNLITSESSIQLVDQSAAQAYVSTYFIKPDWKIGTDLDTVLFWSGKSEDGKVGYEWSGLVDFVKGNDLSSVEWFSHKPSDIYENASLYSHSESLEKLEELKSSYYKHFSRPSVILEVVDGETTYRGEVFHHQIEELKFGEYTGSVYYDKQSKSLETNYMNDFGFNPIITNSSTLSYTYELLNQAGEIIHSDLKTSNLSEVQLPNELADGEYTLVLKSSTINKSILSLTMNSTFVVGEEIQNDLAIPLNQDTPYGFISDSYWHGSLSISRHVQGQYYGHVAYMNYNRETKSYHANYVTENIKPDILYNVQFSAAVGAESTRIHDSIELTGREILKLSNENPLSFSDNLVKVSLNIPSEYETINDIQLILRESTPYQSYNVNVYHNLERKIEAYVPKGNYFGRLLLADENSRKVVDVPAFDLAENKSLDVKIDDLAKIEFLKDNTKLPIFGFNIFNNHYYSYQYNELINSHYMSKKAYEKFSFYVAISDKYETPWGYSISKDNETLTKDVQYQFSGEVNGDVESIEYNENGYVQMELALQSGEFNIDQIYHATKNRYSIMNVTNTEENPIRDYYGLFNDMNNVTISVAIKNKDGQVVTTVNTKPYDLTYIHLQLEEELENGIYTAHVNIPTGPRNSLKVTKEFTVGGESTPVTIDTPSEGFATKDETITVSGSATAEAPLVATLQKGTETIETKNVTASTEGEYSVSFSPTSDGDYKVDVVNGDAHDSVSFTIDRTAPVKASDLKFAESSNGLTVSWTGSADAEKFKVEVAEGTGEFIIAAVDQTTKSFTIPNVKSGTTYKVRITSVDAVGNESLSDVASFDVAAFVAIAISIEDKRNNDELLVIGDELKVSLEGSYEEGFVGKAAVTIDGTAKDIELTYNETSKKYEGSLKIIAGMKTLEKVTGYILDGTEKTNEQTKNLNWSVGSTITGSVTDGDPIKDATVRYTNDKESYSVKTDTEGKYALKGIKAGTYNVSVTFENRTHIQTAVELKDSEVKEVTAFTLPALTNPIFHFVDNGTTTVIDQDDLPVRIEGPNNYIAYGKTKAGKFITNNNTVLKNLVTGKYTITVFGEGLYETTISEVTLTKAIDYTVEVKKTAVDKKDITITIPEGVNKVDSISLYSSSMYEKFNYSGFGNYYKYDVEVTNNKITFKDVVLAEDYHVHVAAEGYMSYNQPVNLKESQTINVALEKGREISGKVTDTQGAVGFVYVSAYAGDTYYSTQTDAEGNYTLKGLSKTEDVIVYVYSQIHLGKNITVAEGPGDITQDFELSKAASLTGTVVDANGKPMSNVSVSASGENYYGWARTAKDGSFAVNGLVDTENYDLEFSAYGYPNLTVEDQIVGEDKQHTLQKLGDGNFNGEGNFFAASKSSVVPGDKIQFTLAYQNNGTSNSTDVPVTLSLPEGLTLISETLQLNGKVVSAENKVVTIPSVEAGKSGKITFEATVKGDVSAPSLTATAKVTADGTVLSASTSVVFVTLEAPAQTGSSSVKVYGNAKHGSTVEIYANNKLVGQTKVDSKWWYSDIKLPVSSTDTDETFVITAKSTFEGKVVNSKPMDITYTPDVPTLTDVKVHAGWNGDVKLNPYTGVATFAIVEHTPLDTEIKFDKEVDSAYITFLGKEYDLVKDGKTFTFDGSKLGKWTSYGEQLLEVTFKKGDVEVTMPLMNIIVLIDPSGFVFEGSMDNKLEGVQAIVETQDKDGNWIQWDAAKFGQINPQVTDSEGRYGWDVITGKWRVIFTKAGYAPYISRVMNVPPPETELNVPMVKLADPAITTSKIDEKNLTVTFDRFMNVRDKNSNVKLYEVQGETRTEVSGTVNTVDKAGYKSIDTPADKQVGFVLEDSNGKDGFFQVDDSKAVSETFTFVPTAALKANTTYVLVVSGNMEDAEARTLGVESEMQFTTEPAQTGNTGGNNGGGVTPPPTSPEIGEIVVDPTTGAQSVTVDVQKMEELIAKATDEVVLDVSKLDASKSIKLSISSSIATKLDAKVKNVTIVTANSRVSIPVIVLKDLAGKGENIVFAVTPVTKSELVKVNTVSPIYDFTLGFEKGGKETAVSSFKEKLKVTFTLNATPKDNRKTAVFYLDEKNNKLVYTGGVVKDGKITFNTSHFSKYVAIEGNKTFKDLPVWSKDYIEVLSSRGIIYGKTNELFGSGESITRAELAVLIARALALETTVYKGKFKDVPASMTWGAKEIEAANKAGIINGFSSTEFKPNEKINRQEMASMIIRALKLKDPSISGKESKLPAFKDAKSISSFAKEDVQLAYVLGIISGFEVQSGSEFRPQEDATRAQAAKVLYLMLQQGNEF